MNGLLIALVILQSVSLLIQMGHYGVTQKIFALLQNNTNTAAQIFNFPNKGNQR